MRVCMVLKRPLGTGGMQRQARAVATRLGEAGVDCSLLAHARGEAGAELLRALPLPISILQSRTSAVFHAMLARHLLAHRNHYDLIHVHGAGPEALTAALVGAVARRPVLAKPSTSGPGTRLGRWATRRGQGPWVRWLLRHGIKGWLAVSERTARELVAAGVPEGRVRLVPNGCDII